MLGEIHNIKHLLKSFSKYYFWDLEPDLVRRRLGIVIGNKYSHEDLKSIEEILDEESKDLMHKQILTISIMAILTAIVAILCAVAIVNKQYYAIGMVTLVYMIITVTLFFIALSRLNHLKKFKYLIRIVKKEK